MKEIVEHFLLRDTGIFPNNALLPVIIYRKVLNLPYFFPANYVQSLFLKNKWGHTWKNGIFTYHHYHSITHEVLGIYKGKTEILLGGETGVRVSIEQRDVILIPAGVAHKNMNATNDVKCIGAYANGRSYDMNYGKPGERPKADRNIEAVPLPATDPVFGTKGKMHVLWQGKAA